MQKNLAKNQDIIAECFLLKYVDPAVNRQPWFPPGGTRRADPSQKSASDRLEILRELNKVL